MYGSREEKDWTRDFILILVEMNFLGFSRTVSVRMPSLFLFGVGFRTVYSLLLLCICLLLELFDSAPNNGWNKSNVKHCSALFITI